MPQTRVEPGHRILTYKSNTVTTTVMSSSSSFLSPTSASATSCNGDGTLTVPMYGDGGGLLSVSGGEGGGGRGGAGGLYAAIGRKPTPMLARKNTPGTELMHTQVSNADQKHTGKSCKVTDQRGQTTVTTSSSKSSLSAVVKLPQIVQNNNQIGVQQVQPTASGHVAKNASSKQDLNKRQDNNNAMLKYTKKKNVSFGESHVVDDSWITDKWCKRGISITALRQSLRKRFRRNRNLVSADKQCSTEMNEQDTEHQMPKNKAPVHLIPILKAPKLSNCASSSKSATSSNQPTMNSYRNMNANSR